MKLKLAIAAAILLFASTAHADSTWVYTYTGNELTGCQCQIDGSFTTAMQIFAPTAVEQLDVLSYSFSVAGFTFDQSDSTGGVFAETDANGNIVEWTVSLDAGNNVNLITTYDGTFNAFDSAIDVYSYGSGPNDTDARFDDPGSWTASDPNSAPMPEPSTLMLLAIGIFAVACVAKKRVLA